MPERSYRYGQDAEDRLRTKLEVFGCVLQRSEVMDHEHKIDFVITHIKDIQRFVTVGVQVTARVDDARKMDDFRRAQETSALVPKRIYLEIGDVDLDRGGAVVAYAGILSFLFDQNFANQATTGLRLHANFDFGFFDLDERIRELRGRSVVASGAPLPPAAIGSELTGTISRFWPDKGYGFIDVPGTLDTFFVISEVTDSLLRQRIHDLPVTSDPITVTFTVAPPHGTGTNPRAVKIRPA